MTEPTTDFPDKRLPRFQLIWWFPRIFRYEFQDGEKAWLLSPGYFRVGTGRYSSAGGVVIFRSLYLGLLEIRRFELSRDQEPTASGEGQSG